MPIIKAKLTKVRCADCGLEQLDPQRKGCTCGKCGTSPVPSAVYPLGSGFHPLDCNCAVGVKPKQIRERKTALVSPLNRLYSKKGR